MHAPSLRNRGAIFWKRRKETVRAIFLLSSSAVEPHIWLHVGQINARLSGNSGLTPPTGNVVLGMPRHPPNLQTDSPNPSLSPSFPSSSYSLFSLSRSLSVFLFLLSANINPQSRSSFTADGQKLIVKALHGVIYQRPLQFTVCGEAGRGLGALRNPA